MFGKNFFNFSVVIHADALVLIAKSLYLIESKNVKSFFFELFKGLTSLIIKSFFLLILLKILLIFIFFFVKKIF